MELTYKMVEQQADAMGLLLQVRGVKRAAVKPAGKPRARRAAARGVAVWHIEVRLRDGRWVPVGPSDGEITGEEQELYAYTSHDAATAAMEAWRAEQRLERPGVEVPETRVVKWK
jgi:hypothetical protein